MAQRRLFLTFILLLILGVSMMLFLYWRSYNSGSPGTSIGQFMYGYGQSESKIPNSYGGSNLSFLPDYTNLETLQLVQIIFRHADRTPLYTFPNDIYRDHDYGVKGLGQLTPKGQIRAIELGKYLRNRYGGYLKPVYDLDEVNVQSSSSDRTLMTASLCLVGLYPGFLGSPLSFQPVPVYAVSRSVDNKLGFYQPCPKHAQLYAEYLKSPFVTSVNDGSVELYEYLSAWSGQNVSSFESLYELTDTLSIQKEEGLKLPDWTNGVYPARTGHVSELEFLGETDTEEMKRLYSGPLVTQLVRNMDVRLGREEWTGEVAELFRKGLKLFLYSAHDTTISNFLNSLGVYNGENPAFASAVMVELHAPPKQDDAESTIKIFYKKNQTEPAEELQLAECGEICHLDTFKQVYENLYIDQEQWLNECALSPRPPNRRRIAVREDTQDLN